MSFRPVTKNLSTLTKANIFDIFMQYDTDRNGYVSYEEAHEVLKDMLGFPREKSIKLCRMCDKNNDGRLSYEEFVDFYLRVQDKMRELKSIFNEFDSNKDGYISMDEARYALKNLSFNDDEIEALIVTYDANQDGRLQYEEFVKMWNAQ